MYRLTNVEEKNLHEELRGVCMIYLLKLSFDGIYAGTRTGWCEQ